MSRKVPRRRRRGMRRRRKMSRRGSEMSANDENEYESAKRRRSWKVPRRRRMRRSKRVPRGLCQLDLKLQTDPSSNLLPLDSFRL